MFRPTQTIEVKKWDQLLVSLFLCPISRDTRVNHTHKCITMRKKSFLFVTFVVTIPLKYKTHVK
jgi:hypothetical protein